MQQEAGTRERIVRSAARLFLSRSYTSVGIADVCAAADVRKGSFYHFFPAKADLAKAVIDLHAGELERRFDLHVGEGGTERARLYALVDAVADIHERFEEQFGRIVGCPFGNFAAELATLDDDVRAHVAAVLQRWEERLAEGCHRAAQAGVLRPGVDPAQLARTLLAQVQGLILLAKVRRGPAESIPADLRGLIGHYMNEEAALP
ncbi:TetR/AcrR family transcriptional regulator [Streptomyces sp. RB6PN25]|uniref:TetR/AcrR family transcriptional regulator n=1 Tax=Streptomyces humicola TaxID=2953240 RepID=A0ABT1PPB4_9ACTN|nr:TetR/AcrR family transcriptional regulator [Streptomyces humicola]MCQ4079516.1 TetR/AcrR family transcriptional regulator [Streptomyces humicola]